MGNEGWLLVNIVACNSSLSVDEFRNLEIEIEKPAAQCWPTSRRPVSGGYMADASTGRCGPFMQYCYPIEAHVISPPLLYLA